MAADPRPEVELGACSPEREGRLPPQARAPDRAVCGDAWNRAVHEQLPAQDREAYRRIYDPRRADWFYLGDVEQRRFALELEAGWGGVSLRLARLFDHVMAVDARLDNARFAQRLFAQEGLANAAAVCARPSAPPVRGESCDLVVSAGLEHAHLWDKGRDPSAAQRHLLSQMHRMMRPGGSLCLRVTNRCSVKAMLGAVRRPGRCASLSHTVSGYRRLLESAGFERVRFYAAFPSHDHPRMMLPLSDPGKLCWAAWLSLARRGRRLPAIQRIAHRLVSVWPIAWLACLISPSLVIWARRPHDRTAETRAVRPRGFATMLKDRILGDWSALGLGGPAPLSLSVVQFSGNWDRGGKVNWFVFPPGCSKPGLVAKIGRAQADSARVAHEHETMQWLKSLSAGVSGVVPRPLALWEMEGHAVSLQEAAGHRPLSGRLSRKRPEAAVAQALRLALPFLTELALASRFELPDDGLHPHLAELIASAASAAEDPRYPPLTRELLAGLAVFAGEGQQARVAPFAVAQHGDMSTGDLLAGPRGELRVVDWEWAVQRGLPFVDLVCLGLSAASLRGAGAIAPTMLALADPEAAHLAYRPVAEIAGRYCARIGLTDAARRPLAAAAVLNLMLRMPNSRMSELHLILPSSNVPVIAAGQALLSGRAG